MCALAANEFCPDEHVTLIGMDVGNAACFLHHAVRLFYVSFVLTMFLQGTEINGD